jgi:hypothetical protein
MNRAAAAVARFVCLALLSAHHFAQAAEVAAEPDRFRLATFSADVTPPLGHPLLGGATVTPVAGRIDDRLLARGFVLIGADKPVVLVTVDWCEIRNDAYDRWRKVLAEAAGTEPVRVLVTSVHQHDAPLADLEAQRILSARKVAAKICDPEFHEQCVQATAKALRTALRDARRVTHLGLGQAKVMDVASSRRYLGADGQPRFDRSSMSGGDSLKAKADAGTIDPWLKTVSFWDGDTPLCALSSYAVHPMSYWGTGWVTSDFPGLARQRRQADEPAVFQIYASGASGNVTAGKFNNGSHANRAVLTSRLHDAMKKAWSNTKRHALTPITFRSAELDLKPRDDAGFSAADLEKMLSHADAKKQSLAALGLSWRNRVAAGVKIDVPAIDFGVAQIVLLPGESYVEYQLAAQKMRPDSFVLVMGYGECAPGFIAPEAAWRERDGNLSSWCWAAPGAEKAMIRALETVLRP